jgi:hypothetical protein
MRKLKGAAKKRRQITLDSAAPPEPPDRRFSEPHN